jgi:hypothetical protein
MDLKIEDLCPVFRAEGIAAEERGAHQLAQPALRRSRQQINESRQPHGRRSHESAQSDRAHRTIQGKYKNGDGLSGFPIENR